MNDGDNLYLALRIASPIPESAVNFTFDNDHDGVYEEGDDDLIVNWFGFYDEFVSRLPPCEPGYTCFGIQDTAVGGTSEGSGVVETTGTHTFIELAHPLDTADNGHDFSLRFGKRVGSSLFVLTCPDGCASTFLSRRDIVIFSTSTTPPDTQITGGPADGSFSREDVTELTFAGSDDAIAAEDLRFECSENDAQFEPCESSLTYYSNGQGPQSFAVRAIDERGNVDPTPAERHWTYDTEEPEKPTVRGPRRFRSARVVYRLSATDNVDEARQLRFRCAVDRAPLRTCRARLALRVSRGRHVLRVRAIDRTGNVGRATRVRFVRA
jgi:hypothetical protein